MILSLFCITGFFSLGQGTLYIDSIVSGNMYRKFRIYVPQVYNALTPAPLIIDLHGYTSNSVQEQYYTNFMPIADTAGFLTVYPDGTQSFGGQFWNSGITGSPNDVQFISDLINYCEANYNINYKRVYSCGMSNGGIMSYFLACELSARITAIASVTGSMLNAWYTNCNPSRPVPVMQIHGTNDGTVPYAGDANFAPVDSVIKKWVRINNCNNAPAVLNLPNINGQDNSSAVNYRYAGGNNGSTVELYKVSGGSHSWPGAFPIFENTNQDFSASKEIWRFFRQYQLGQFISNVGVADRHSDDAVRVFPNPTSSTIYISGLQLGTYSLFSPDGKRLTGELSSGTLDLSDYQPGIYFLHLREGFEVSVVKIIRN